MGLGSRRQQRVDFGNVAYRKLHDRGFAALRFERLDKNRRARRRGFRPRRRKVPDFVAVGFPAKRKGKAAVRDERRQLAELRRDAHPPVCVRWAADLDSGRSSVVGDNRSLREANEAVDEFVLFTNRSMSAGAR